LLFVTANSNLSSSVIARASNSLCSNDFNASSCAFISASAAAVAASLAAFSSVFNAKIWLVTSFCFVSLAVSSVINSAWSWASASKSSFLLWPKLFCNLRLSNLVW